MIEIQADAARNLLTISYSGRVAPEEIVDRTSALDAALVQMRPGFTCLTDMTKLEEMEPACAVEIRKIMGLLAKHGIKRVVRVIPDPSKDIGLSIMSLFHYPRDVQLVTCESLGEAMSVLGN